ncbi:small GTP-binding protein [Tritrichomonas foetus]|uniref:Small GTP-binding protein n=1 Tax=Tritrichomonas foetus TaxID=1144522 RepID=A0A1J4K809_9EUKA|nr:small GTP-binding protein [Tritrichomonas foetus]|eukprot:OHT07535.1 small GTP-binding protein [Tritrichomonas foetus]
MKFLNDQSFRKDDVSIEILNDVVFSNFHIFKVTVIMSYPKIVLVGETNVGKTSLSVRYRTSQFSEESPATIGAANILLPVHLENETVTLDLWDTAGQERYRSLTPMYFQGCIIAIFVYDISKLQTFSSLDTFLSLLQQKAPENCAIVVVGNKSDMDIDREVSIPRAEAYSQKIGALFYMETSAKNGTGVEELFTRVAEVARDSHRQKNDISLSSKENESNQKQCC